MGSSHLFFEKFFALGVFTLALSSCQVPYNLEGVARPDLIDNNSSGDLGNGQGRGNETPISKLPGFNNDQKHDGREELAPGYTAYSDLFHVEVAERKVDVLFVLDNSQSMSEEQENVVSSFENFLQYFLDQNIDYHIGVLSTDASTNSTPWTGEAYANFPNNGAGSLLAKTGNNRFIDSTLSKIEAIRQFGENARLGTKGNGAETGILSLLAAFHPRQLNDWNKDFLREDALLSMIVLSDEDESKSPDDLSYLRSDATLMNARLSQFQTRLQQLKPQHRGRIRFDAIVAPSRALCTSLGSSSQTAGTGDFYMTVARQLSSAPSKHIFNICEDFSGDLATIGSELSVSVERNFELSEIPVGTIVVKLDGLPLTESRTEGWTYDARRNEISLHGLSLENKREFDLRINFVHR
jgi:hypothetical protein